MTDQTVHVSHSGKPPRDVRLDFFRGLAMLIIFVAHMPDNSWFLFIPARFGFSSAGELFVFCSGLASSFAFGRIFVKNGWLAGTRRILFRMWQVYWAHIGLALVLMSVSVEAFQLTGTNYPQRLGLDWLFSHAGEGLLKLMTLGFTPAFLDILPMYLALLAMVPVMVALGRVSRALPLALMLGLWLAVQATGINLPGGQEPGMVWFFNPFAWQMVFFTGFAFGMKWLPMPRLERGTLFWFCVAFLVVSVPVNFWAFTDQFAALSNLHDVFVPEMGKTNLVAPLYLHFMASAYVALVLVDPIRDRLAAMRPIILIGQQALATFMASIVLSWTCGILLDQVGRNGFTLAIANLSGFAMLLGIAVLARAYKGGGKTEKTGAPPVRSSEGAAAGPLAPQFSPAE
jgi:hypothetical protein